jgi:hypothetical protein
LKCEKFWGRSLYSGETVFCGRRKAVIGVALATSEEGLPETGFFLNKTKVQKYLSPQRACFIKYLILKLSLLKSGIKSIHNRKREFVKRKTCFEFDGLFLFSFPMAFKFKTGWIFHAVAWLLS